MENTILTITGPSGSGKSTLARHLEQTSKFKSVVSYTTRPARVGELNGVHYHFTSKDFLASLEAVETVEFHGHTYGATRQQLDLIWSTGKTPILVLTPEGLQQVCDYCATHRVRMVSVYLDGDVVKLMKRYLSRITIDELTTPKELDNHAFRLDSIVAEVEEWTTHFNRMVVYPGVPHMIVPYYNAETMDLVHESVCKLV